MNEQRREPRVRVDWPVLASGFSGRGEGRVVDISLCGILFEADVELAERDFVLLRISVDAHTIVECVAQVVRAGAHGGSRAYGADIRYISALDRQRLSFALLLLQEPAHAH